jgi:hypothetical protein
LVVGLRRRPPVNGDAPAVAELVIAYERSLYGATGYSLGDLQAEWETLDLARDALVVLDGERVVAFGSLDDRGQLWRVEGYVQMRSRSMQGSRRLSPITGSSGRASFPGGVIFTLRPRGSIRRSGAWCAQATRSWPAQSARPTATAAAGSRCS